MIKRDLIQMLHLNLVRLISRIETTPSYGIEEGVLLKPKIIRKKGDG